MNLYSLRNFLTGNGAVWLKLNTTDLENMVEKTVSHKSLKLEGKNSNGHANTLHLTSDFEHPVYESGTGLKRLTIVSGSWKPSAVGSSPAIDNVVGSSLHTLATHRRFGYFYPEVGIWILNQLEQN